MLTNEENKMIDAAQPKDEVTFKAASGVMYDFFFPGSGKWKPVTVRAESREVAQKLWEANRVLVNPEPEVKEEPKTEVKAEEQTNKE